MLNPIAFLPNQIMDKNGCSCGLLAGSGIGDCECGWLGGKGYPPQQE